MLLTCLWNISRHIYWLSHSFRCPVHRWLDTFWCCCCRHCCCCCYNWCCLWIFCCCCITISISFCCCSYWSCCCWMHCWFSTTCCLCCWCCGCCCWCCRCCCCCCGTVWGSCCLALTHVTYQSLVIGWWYLSDHMAFGMFVVILVERLRWAVHFGTVVTAELDYTPVYHLVLH